MHLEPEVRVVASVIPRRHHQRPHLKDSETELRRYHLRLYLKDCETELRSACLKDLQDFDETPLRSAYRRDLKDSKTESRRLETPYYRKSIDTPLNFCRYHHHHGYLRADGFGGGRRHGEDQVFGGDARRRFERARLLGRDSVVLRLLVRP